MKIAFHFSVAWSEEDGVYIARVDELPSLAAHGDNCGSAMEGILYVLAVALEDE